MRVAFLKSSAAGLAAWLGVFALAPTAQAANPLEMNFWLSGPRYDGNLPACEAGLPSITHQFAEKEGTYWNSALRITGYARIQEVAFRPWQSDNIPRRYCTGDALLNDGKVHRLHYSIIEDGGLAGFADGIEFCIVGLDRNWAFNPACKAARP
ncbi:hypothetical protein [Rhodopseudomonas palustris]|uniref:Uncharacterized protein n=1 Tax=Rhodopseudomonas palustris TaxID=1076 RepID=A0A418UWZ6_RHOPL|nr:hypothetical protein [Rhodopseudomonas palustris]RJF64208.1 hypothetical protein D4Q52_25465 [Rhodopseudomonas palustris]